AEVLEFRAERSKDPEEAKTLAYKAAELRSEHEDDPARALAAWRVLLEKHGPARRVFDRMIPLLEKLEDYEALAEALESNAKLQSPEESAPTLAELGRLRMEFLGDARGALEAFQRALRADPQN